MTDENHVVESRSGREFVSALREENPDKLPDFSGMDLKDADLNGADLSDMNLSRAKLIEADLRDANLRGANLSRANLRGADLTDANLRNANLRGANLCGTNLDGADLSGAILQDVNLLFAQLSNKTNLFGTNLSGMSFTGVRLSDVDLSNTNLSDATFSGVNLSKVNLSGANLSSADLRQATLIDSRLDGANLTGAKLWETQRSGWSIKGIICQWACWDRDGEEETKYKDGAFERIYAEKSRIVLRYAGGISPVDLAMLPLIVEQLQAKHSDSSLHIRSVQDDGSGAVVTITVDDRIGRNAETFAAEVEVLRYKLNSAQKLIEREQKRIQREKKLSQREKERRLQSEGEVKGIKNLMDRMFPILEKAMSEPTYTSHNYNNYGQTGAAGPNARAHDNTFQQVQNQGTLDLPRLAEELKRLRAAMKEADGKDDQDEAIGAVAAAEKAAVKGDGPTTLGHLKAAGQWTLGIAQQIGVGAAVEAIKRAM